MLRHLFFLLPAQPGLSLERKPSYLFPPALDAKKRDLDPKTSFTLEPPALLRLAGPSLLGHSITA